MTRRTQKSVLNLSFFLGALLLILYLNRERSSSTAFAWTTVRYKTSAPSLPETRGICPGLASSTKPALVVSRVTADGDPKWLDSLANLYHLCVYTADAPLDKTSNHLQVPANRGHEAMAYLTFIVDNYADMPAAGAVFVHGSRWAWHNDQKNYDNAPLLKALNVSAALEPLGYHNLRCDWSASTCSSSSAKAQGSFETSLRAVLEPWNARVISDAALPRAIAALFGDDGSIALLGADESQPDLKKTGAQTTLGRGDAIRSQCCAQFVVARDRIWQHTREEYIALRQWLLDGSSVGKTNRRLPSNAAPPDDRIAGRIMSYLWHILFIQHNQSSHSSMSGKFPGIDLNQLNTLACPRADECYCRLYGRCHLSGCKDPGRCRGQYQVPPGFKLPADWAETHAGAI